MIEIKLEEMKLGLKIVERIVKLVEGELRIKIREIEIVEIEVIIIDLSRIGENRERSVEEDIINGLEEEREVLGIVDRLGIGEDNIEVIKLKKENEEKGKRGVERGM